MITADHLQGHWQRHWIKAPGFEDHDTKVHWMQAGMVFADLRIPAGLPYLGGATCLADLPAATLAELGAAEGFAGTTTLEDDRCTWHRAINWQGVPEGADVGQISFDDKGRMIETGVLANYTELWAQQAKAPPRALQFSDGTYDGVLVICGALGVLGIDHAGKAPTAPLRAALREGVILPEAVDAFDGIFALVRVTGEALIAELATNPFQQGECVLSLTEGGAVWHKEGFDGAKSEIALQVSEPASPP